MMQNLFSAVTDFTITEARSHVMTFSAELDLTYLVIFIHNPINAFHYYAYTSPLTNLTWLFFLLWIIATPPILFLVARLTVFLLKILCHMQPDHNYSYPTLQIWGTR